MIEKDGWCYAENQEPMLAITAAENLGAYKLKVHFNTGDERIFDGRILLSAEVFAPLADEKIFADYKLDCETLTWLGGEVDIAPEFVLEHSSVE